MTCQFRYLQCMLFGYVQVNPDIGSCARRGSHGYERRGAIYVVQSGNIWSTVPQTHQQKMRHGRFSSRSANPSHKTNAPYPATLSPDSSLPAPLSPTVLPFAAFTVIVTQGRVGPPVGISGEARLGHGDPGQVRRSSGEVGSRR